MRSVAALLIVVAAAASCTRREAATTEDSVSAALRQAVDARQPAFVTDDDDRGREVWKEEQRFYRQNGYQLAWSNGRRPRADVDALIRALRAADQEGLDPAEYPGGSRVGATRL